MSSKFRRAQRPKTETSSTPPLISPSQGGGKAPDVALSAAFAGALGASPTSRHPPAGLGSRGNDLFKQARAGGAGNKPAPATLRPSRVAPRSGHK